MNKGAAAGGINISNHIQSSVLTGPGEGPKVAIVIVSWNGRNDLLECLASVSRLQPPPSSVIVVDNGSTDGTEEAVAKYYPRAAVLRLEKNLGFAGGNNRGIEKALAEGAEYICLLNNDTVVDPDFLLELLRTAGHRPRAGIFGSRILYYSHPETVWSQGIAVHRLTGRIYTPFHNRRADELRDENADDDAVSGAAMLLKAETLRAVGGFNEEYFLCFEDVNLCLRARRRGYQVVTVPASRVRHKVSGSMGGEYSPTVVYYSTRNHLLAINRECPVSVFWRGTRNFLIVLYTLLFAGLAAGPPRGPKLRAWRRGLADYFRGRFGEWTG